MEDGVAVLDRPERRPAPGLGDVGRLPDPGRSEIRASDLPDLPRADELVKRAERLLDRDVRVREVELVVIDPIRPEPTEATLHGLADPGRASALEPVLRAPGCSELGRDHEAVPATVQGPPQVLLGQTVSVDVGGIDVVDSRVGCRVHDLAARPGIESPPEVVASEADDRDP